MNSPPLVFTPAAGDTADAPYEPAAALKREPVTPNEQQLADLTARLSPDSLARADEPLAKRTTLRVGGKADLYVEPASEADLAAVLKFIAEKRLNLTVIGRGSNLLIKDGGIRGVVVKFYFFNRLFNVRTALHLRFFGFPNLF